MARSEARRQAREKRPRAVPEERALRERRQPRPRREPLESGAGDHRRPPQASAGAAGHASFMRRLVDQEDAGGQSQEPEVLGRTGNLPRKPASRNSPEAPPLDGTLGCWATGAGAAGGFGGAQNRACVAPTSCPGNLPARPLPFLPPLLASRNPCPWHYVHLSGSHDTLVPTCFEAKLHQKGSGPTPSATSTLAERASPAMATYTYTSRPRALPCQRRRYRDDLMQQPEEPVHYGNIMYDRRVIRGNTYALQSVPLVSTVRIV